MWKAIIEGAHDTCHLAPLCTKFGVTDFVTLLGAWSEGEYFFHTDAHVLQGEERSKEGFITGLMNNKEIIKTEGKGNFLITLTRRKKGMEEWEFLWDKRIIHLRPVVQRSDGTERWEIAFWKKDLLMDYFKKMGEGFRLKSIQRTKLQNIFLPNILPSLTSRQWDAVETAVSRGYYSFPRKTTLETLAHEKRISKPTYHQHLRTAEGKLMGFLTEFGDK